MGVDPITQNIPGGAVGAAVEHTNIFTFDGTSKSYK